mmetsp:Transcript_8106/g.31941  ORF Transcript_8106/g.31941 Transcript_8106/m.31941 type:complete len:227 (-) Transcript_8106:362-1042(-)
MMSWWSTPSLDISRKFLPDSASAPAGRSSAATAPAGRPAAAADTARSTSAASTEAGNESRDIIAPKSAFLAATAPRCAARCAQRKHSVVSCTRNRTATAPLLPMMPSTPVATWAACTAPMCGRRAVFAITRMWSPTMVSDPTVVKTGPREAPPGFAAPVAAAALPAPAPAAEAPSRPPFGRAAAADSSVASTSDSHSADRRADRSDKAPRATLVAVRSTSSCSPTT